MSETNSSLPHWDMSAVYPGLDSAEFLDSLAQNQADIAALQHLWDAHGIMVRQTAPAVDAELATLFETALAQLNQVLEYTHTLYAYVMGFVATDSRNVVAQARQSELQLQTVQLDQLQTRLTAWLGALDVEALIARSAMAKAHAYALREAKIAAQHLMSPEEEALATELNLTGGRAWATLYNNFSSQITADVVIGDEVQRLPLTAIRNLAFESDRDLRRRAYVAELSAWETHALPIAAALNSIKGQMNVLSRRRNWQTPLDVALFQNHIDRETLEVMLTTAQSFFPDFRRYLKVKARALGLDTLTWYDLFAPVGANSQEWTFSTSQDFIIREFHTFSPRLGGLAEQAFREQWIDAEPRDGKRGGAFCAWVRGGESRILANFKANYGGMSTLAHELGHAYHNLARVGCTYIQRQTPMTLAETASNFCEIIVREAALKLAPPDEQLAILESSLQDATQVIVDITSRYLFETEVFARRQRRELAVAEFNAMMLDSQRATYGDGLDPEYLHPYMWAVKSHYYGSIFYNFPYMFGLLFSLGLFARYREAPGGFLARYDDLLSATGMDDAATLAVRFGMDVRRPEFWEKSLQEIVKDIDRFEQRVTETHSK